ncbi:SSR1 family protein [Megaselia abdita]
MCFLANKLFAFAEDELDESADVDDGNVTGDEADIEDDLDSTTSPFADTYLLFTRPAYVSGSQFELPGGKPVEFLVGFLNKGDGNFIIESVEASFRYQHDYFVQNFSAVSYNREVRPGVEATVSYQFLPSEQFAGRPFGLNIALNYKDFKGQHYVEHVFNETVFITEIDEGLDGETFFLYILMAGIAVLLLVLGQQYLIGNNGKRKRASTHKKIEIGTMDKTNVDYDWLPEETLRALQQTPKGSKSPKGKNTPKSSPNGKIPSSPKGQQSPRQRKLKAGSD